MSYRTTFVTLAAVAAGGALAAPAMAAPAADQHVSGHNISVAPQGGRGTDQAGGGSSASPQLQAIAQCESGGDPAAIGGGGTYRGKYQFTYETWAAVGGSGDPAAAPEPEQDRRAATLLAQSGSSQWPVCGA